MKKILTAVFVLVAAVNSVWAAEDSQSKKYNFGIFPYYDAATLVSLHKPLKDYLEKETGIQAVLRSSANFKSFKNRTADGMYDILMTAPHLGRIAHLKNGYQWIGFTGNKSHAVFVVKKDSRFNSAADLSNQTISLPPKAAIIHYMALKRLAEHGIKTDQVTVNETKSHNNALMTVVNGTAPAAAFGKPTWDRYVRQHQSVLKRIDQSDDIPGFAILVHSRLDKSLIKKIQDAMFKFAETEQGKKYFTESGLKGLKPANEEDFALLDEFLGRKKSNNQ